MPAGEGTRQTLGQHPGTHQGRCSECSGKGRSCPVRQAPPHPGATDKAGTERLGNGPWPHSRKCPEPGTGRRGVVCPGRGVRTGVAHPLLHGARAACSPARPLTAPRRVEAQGEQCCHTGGWVTAASHPEPSGRSQVPRGPWSQSAGLIDPSPSRQPARPSPARSVPGHPREEGRPERLFPSLGSGPEPPQRAPQPWRRFSQGPSR